MTNQQITFFKELSDIQKCCTNVALSKENKYRSTEELLKDVTYDVIYKIMELLDGYGGNLPKCNIINSETEEIINSDIQLHDKCVDFLEDSNLLE